LGRVTRFFGPSIGGHAGDDAALLLSTPSEAYVRWRQLDDSANTCSIRLEAECVEDALWDDSNAPLFVLLQSRGVTIRNGTLRLPAGYMLLLEGLVAMVNLSIVSSDEADAEGSASSTAHRLPPLVFVSQASVTMENVTVGPNCAGYGIGVGDGGNLELCDCAVSGQRSSGLVVRGASANLLAERCRFEQNGQDGVHVLEGATASLFSCHFVANRAMGFGVGHETSVALLSECCSERNEFGFVGHNGGMLTLQDCSSSHNKNGVHAMDGATMVRGVGGALAINQQGVHVGEGAQVCLTHSAVVRSHFRVHDVHAGACRVPQVSVAARDMHHDGSGLQVPYFRWHCYLLSSRLSNQCSLC
jgi:hypothetical protein